MGEHEMRNTQGLDAEALGDGYLYGATLGTLAQSLGRREGDLVAMLVEEIDMIDLLERPAGEASLMLDQVLEIGGGGDDVVAQHRLEPGPVGAGPHRGAGRSPAVRAGR